MSSNVEQWKQNIPFANGFVQNICHVHTNDMNTWVYTSGEATLRNKFRPPTRNTSTTTYRCLEKPRLHEGTTHKGCHDDLQGRPRTICWSQTKINSTTKSNPPYSETNQCIDTIEALRNDHEQLPGRKLEFRWLVRPSKEILPVANKKKFDNQIKSPIQRYQSMHWRHWNAKKRPWKYARPQTRVSMTWKAVQGTFAGRKQK